MVRAEGPQEECTRARVKAFSKTYFEEQDVVGAFIGQCCELGDDKRVSTSVLLDAFNAWSDEKRLNSKALAAAMRGKGFEKKVLRVSGVNTNCYVGLCLKG